MNIPIHHKDENKVPLVAIIFSNLVIVFCIIFSIVLITYSIIKFFNNPPQTSLSFYLFFMFIGILFLMIFLFALRHNNHNIRINLTFLVIGTVISLYGFELYLHSHKRKQSYKKPQNENYSNFDNRSKIQVIRDYLESGVKVYPAVHASTILPLISDPIDNKLLIEGNPILPFGHISNSRIILCNENGFWLNYVSDKYGFNNPNSIYDKGNIDIVIIGDSYAEGYCVQNDENISSQLNKLKYNVINLGKSGNGPLMEYAVIKEYLQHIQHKVLLWVYCSSNDMIDLKNEMNSSFLKSYINNDNFSQDLINRQDIIDSTLIKIVDSEWERSRLKEVVNQLDKLQLLKLENLRTRINLLAGIEQKYKKDHYSDDYKKEIFRNIIIKSNEFINSLNGKLYFIYLPDYNYALNHENNKYRLYLINLMKELNIPFIDIQKNVFDIHDNPISFFAIGGESYHYTAEAYNLITNVINIRLKADGIKSIVD